MSWKSVTQPTVWGAKSSRQMRNMRYVQKAVRAGKVVSRRVPYLALPLLAYDGYNYVTSLDESDFNQQLETPQPSRSYIGVNSSDRSTQFSEYQYPSIVGYQDDGPVHWSRTV